MKVILLKDVPKLGKKYEVKSVKNGYGRNFLLPRKLAEIAVAGNLKNLEARKKIGEESKKKMEQKLFQSLEKLKGKEIIIKTKANKRGELYGSVSSETISEELKKQGFNIDSEYIQLQENIKKIGEYEIEIKIGDSVCAIKLKVENE